MSNKILNQLHIQLLEDGNIKLKADKPVQVLDVLQITCLTQLMMMGYTVNTASPEQQQAVKEDLYDRYNQAVSRVLESFAPDLELRPNLTAEAILRAENKIISEKAAKCPENTPDSLKAKVPFKVLK